MVFLTTELLRRHRVGRVGWTGKLEETGLADRPCPFSRMQDGNTSENVRVGKASRPRNTMLEIITLFDFVKRKA